MQQTDAHIMSSIEVLWNEANAIETLSNSSQDDEHNHQSDDIIIDDAEPITSADYDMGELKQRVEKASLDDETVNLSVTPDDAINRIKHATTLSQQNPKPLPGDINQQSPEYMFGEAFTNLVRHIVIDYLDKSVEPIIGKRLPAKSNRYLKTKNPKRNKRDTSPERILIMNYTII